MKHINKYYKNSNTGELIHEVETTETEITGIPIRYYNINGQPCGENIDLVGFVEISKKKFNREKRKQKK